MLNQGAQGKINEYESTLYTEPALSPAEFSIFVTANNNLPVTYSCFKKRGLPEYLDAAAATQC